MRLFEIILAVICLLLLYSNSNKAALKILTVLAVFVLCIHIVVEGFRWQILPIYVILGVTITVLLLNISVKQYWLAITLAIGTAGVILSVLFSYLLPVFSIQNTTGKHAIASNTILFNNDKNVFKIWYPIQPKTNSQNKATYNNKKLKNGIMGLPNFFIGHLNLVKTNAYKTGDLITEEKYPLIVYAHGASSIMVDNTFLLENIASNGYVVITLQHDFSFAKYGIDPKEAKKIDASIQKKLIEVLLNKAVPNQVDNYKQLFTHLKNSNYTFIKAIDFERIGLVGHSLGGATATSTAPKLPNVKAVVNIDGAIKNDVISNFTIPFLYISSFSPYLSDSELKKKKVQPQFYREVKDYELKPVKKFFQENIENTYWVRFKDANHLDLTDMPFVVPFFKSKEYHSVKGSELKSEIIINFLDNYLKRSTKNIVITDHSLKWIKTNKK